MSFRDPFGPFRADAGPDLVPDDPPIRRDIWGQDRGPEIQIRDRSRFRRSKGVVVFAGATAALTLLLSIPIVYLELAAVEAVAVHGKTLTAAEFADRLQNLLLGTAIVAFSLVSFIASAAVVSSGLVVRPKPAPETQGPASLSELVPLRVGRVHDV